MITDSELVNLIIIYLEMSLIDGSNKCIDARYRGATIMRPLSDDTSLENIPLSAAVGHRFAWRCLSKCKVIF